MGYVKELLKDLNDLRSPNMIRFLVLGDDFIYLLSHGADSPDYSYYKHFEVDKIDEDPLYFLSERTFATLEGLFVASKFSRSVVFSDYVRRGQSSDIRLYAVGSLGSGVSSRLAQDLDSGKLIEEVAEDYGINFLKDYGDAVSIYPLQPEHYDWDAEEGKPLFQALENDYNTLMEEYMSEQEGYSEPDEELEPEVEEPEVEESEVEELEEEPEKVEVDKSRQFSEEDQQVLRMYKTSYSSAVKVILSNYALMFTAAYQLKRPYGVLTLEDGVPNIVTIKGTSREYTSLDGALMHKPLAMRTINAAGLKVCKTRNAWDIAQLVLTGRTMDGSETASLSDRLYFPNKMLEFAYGLETPKMTEGGRTNYPRHSKAESWDSYSSVVKRSIEQVMEVLVVSVARNKKAEALSKGETVDYTSPDVHTLISESVEKVKNAFLTCFLIAEVVQISGELGLLKIKILDPYGLDISRNIATDVANDAYSLMDSVSSLSRAVVTDKTSKYYSVHTFEGNSKMVNAMPLFAYKAAESVLKAGRSINYDNMILGIDINDNILQNGSGRVDMKPKISHYTIARSRAGKGVEGLSKLANAIKSGKVLAYDDDKPDMASMILELCSEAFVMNGGNSQVNEKGGTNIQGFFTPEDYVKWSKPELVPKFLSERGSGVFDSNQPHIYGDIYYLRFVLLVMAMIDARVRIPGIADLPEFKDDTGKDGGIVAFFDEFNNLNSSLRGLLTRMYSKEFASTNYYLNEKKIRQAKLDGVEEKKLPSQTQTKPSPMAYWSMTLVEKLKVSADRIRAGKNAGYGNGENTKTDIYIIGQELPDIVDSGTPLSDYYPERMATKNTANMSNLKKDYYPLAPLVAPFGQDILVGYSEMNYLNQHNGFAKDKLNAQNRMFAYVDNFNPDTRDKIERGDEQFASSVPVYYKPFLILPSHDHNKYYVKNSMEFLSSAGLDVEGVIEQNAKVDENGTPIEGPSYNIDFIGSGGVTIHSGVQFNEAIGLKGYLNYIGMTDEQIYNNLKKGGDAANKFMELIQYPGTWREFILDLRPEYLFSIDDINESIVSNVPLSSITTQSSGEFYDVYPELFTTSTAYDSEQANLSGDGGEAAGLDLGLFGSTVNESGENITSFDYDVPSNGDLSSVNEIDRRDGLFDDLVLNAESDYYENSKPVDLPIEDRLADLGLSGVKNLTPELQALIYKQIQDDLAKVPPIQNVNHEDLGYGKLGVVYDSDGRAYKVDTSQLDKTEDNNDAILLDDNIKKYSQDGIFNYSSLVKTVTDKALSTASLEGGIKSIYVVGDGLIVNNVKIALHIPEEYLQSLPFITREHIRLGQLAKYFDYSRLRYSRVSTIKIDSSQFVFDHFSEGMGYTKNFDIRQVFEDLRSLQLFVIGTKNYDRRLVMDDRFTTSDDEFYNPRLATKAYRLSQVWLRKRYLGSLHGMEDTWRRNDIGTFRKLGTSSAYAAGAVITGAAQVTGWAGRGLFGKVSRLGRELGKDFKDLMNETSNMSSK